MAIRPTIVLIAVILLSSTIPAGAQYFGRNKVQYQRFDFQVLSSEHFDVYYYPQEEAAVRVATRLAERWYSQLSQLFKHELSSRQKLILYAAHPHFQQTRHGRAVDMQGRPIGWVREASFRNAMPTIDRLDDPDFFPYRYGHAFWTYVAGRSGDRVVGEMLRATGPQGDIEAAVQSVLGVDTKTLTTEWHESTRRSYAGVFESGRSADSFGKPLISRDSGGGDLNLAPALSPDGRRMVFLSEKSLFSIDMYVADVATGKITRKIVVRANVLGYAIAEIDYVRPFDRSRRGWVWQFGLTPGF